MFPESCHSVTLGRVLLFVKLRHFSKKRSLQQSHFRAVNTLAFWTQKVVLPSSVRGCLCHPSCLLWFHGFWRTFEAAGCVRSVMSQPQKQDCHTLNAWIWRARLGLAAIKIEIKNSLEWLCQSKKRCSAWQSLFGSVEPCDLLETRSSLQCAINQS